MQAFPLRGRWVRKHSDEVENITLFLKATPHQSVKLTASPQGEALHLFKHSPLQRKKGLGKIQSL